jgi:hypothetical protein
MEQEGTKATKRALRCLAWLLLDGFGKASATHCIAARIHRSAEQTTTMDGNWGQPIFSRERGGQLRRRR